MKKITQLLMLLVTIPFLMQSMHGQCIINSDEDAADYCSDPCSTIEGLTITDVADLDCFVDLNSVGGDLKIQGTFLGSLGDLCELNSVGGDIIIDGNYEINLVGFCDLSSVGGDLIITNNGGADELLDFSSIEYIGGDLIVTGNENLEICCDLHCLVVATQGNVLIEDNGPVCSVFEEIEGCEECPRICNEDFILDSQMAVDSFLVNNGCTVIEGDVLITGNDIVDLTGISQLEAIVGTLTIDNCENLTNLGTLTVVDIDNLIVSNNSSLENISSQALTIYGDVTINNNSNLVDLDLLSWNIQGDLTIENNSLLTACCDLLCAYILGNITIENNGANCSSFGEVEMSCPDPMCMYGAIDWTTLSEGEDASLSNIEAKDVVVLEDGYVVTGSINYPRYYSAFKISLEGELLWDKPDDEFYTGQTYGISQTDDDGFIIVGNDGGSFSQKNCLVSKLDENGDLLWTQTYGGDKEDEAKKVIMTNDGNFVIVGHTESNNGDVSENQGNFDGWIIKIDGDGNLLWEQTYGGSSTERFRDIKETSDGNLILVGATQSNDGDLSVNQGESDCWVLKLDENGNILWSKTYGGSDWDWAYSLLIDDGGYVIGGFSESDDGDVTKNRGEYDGWCFKLDEEGNLLWENSYGGLENDYIFDISLGLDNGYVFTGSTQSQGGDVGVYAGDRRTWFGKINEVGELIGIKNIESFRGNAIEQINDGYVVVGLHSLSTESDVRYWVVKIIETPLTNIHLCLEGAYDPAIGRMKTILADEGILPLTQPYNVPPYNYNGTESVDSTIGFPENTVDWILLEARSGTPNLVGESGTEVVETIAALLLADGSVVSPDGSDAYFRNLEEGASYHIAIRHRNHLDIISQEAIEADSRMTYYFTLSQDQAFGTNQQKVLEDGKVVMYTGDYSQDGIIQVTDYDLWKEAPAQNNVYGNTDGTVDGIIQVTDYDAWIPNKAKIGNIEIQY